MLMTCDHPGFHGICTMKDMPMYLDCSVISIYELLWNAVPAGTWFGEGRRGRKSTVQATRV